MTAEAREPLCDDRVRVVDGFLTEGGRARMLAFCEQEDYAPVHAPTVSKVWRPHDGVPWKGKSCYFTSQAVPPARRESFHPVGKAIDEFWERLLPLVRTAGALTGVEGRDWNALVASCFVYPAGTSLSLHTDGRKKYFGGFVYYCHARWNVNWGGGLLLYGADAAAPMGKRWSGGLFGADDDQAPAMSQDLLNR
jgi:hypothetical protein